MVKDTRQADTEIEVTPEMIAAGLEEYAHNFIGLHTGEDGYPEMVVKLIYQAMFRVSASQPENQSESPCGDR